MKGRTYYFDPPVTQRTIDSTKIPRRILRKPVNQFPKKRRTPQITQSKGERQDNEVHLVIFWRENIQENQLLQVATMEKSLKKRYIYSKLNQQIQRIAKKKAK